MTMSNVIPIEYEGRPVDFSAEGWINATKVAKRFGRLPNEWLRLNETQSYMRALAAAVNAGEPRNLIQTVRGRNGGTWLHPKLAVHFARWLDVYFAVWCDLRIAESAELPVSSVCGRCRELLDLGYIDVAGLSDDSPARQMLRVTAEGRALLVQAADEQVAKQEAADAQ